MLALILAHSPVLATGCRGLAHRPHHCFHRPGPTAPAPRWLVGFSGGLMGGDDSQKLLPWRGIRLLSGAQQASGYSKINNLTQRPSAPAVVPTRRRAGLERTR